MTTSTPYDDVFRTLLTDCSELFLPVLNESFGEHYTGKERIPFHLFCYEKDFGDCEKDEKKLQELKARYAAIMKRLEALQDAGAIDEFTKRAITDMAKEVARHLAGKYEKVKEGVETTMGGKILNYEAKDILNQGRAEGLAEGHAEGIVQATLSSIRNLMSKMHMTAAEAMNILEVPASEQEKYASQL